MEKRKFLIILSSCSLAMLGAFGFLLAEIRHVGKCRLQQERKLSCWSIEWRLRERAARTKWRDRYADGTAHPVADVLPMKDTYLSQDGSGKRFMFAITGNEAEIRVEGDPSFRYTFRFSH